MNQSYAEHLIKDYRLGSSGFSCLRVSPSGRGDLSSRCCPLGRFPHTTMALLTGSWLTDCMVLVLSLLALVYWFFTRTANYFKDRGVPYLPQFPLLGRIELFTKSQYDVAKLLYNSFPNERFFGFFQTRIPTLVVKDPNLIHHILVKDFAHFHDRGFPTLEHDAMTQNLFNLNGQKWRHLRYKLIPTFTTGKLKNMFDQLDKCGNHMVEDLRKTSKSGEGIDARLFMAPFTSEVIASTAFGLDFSKSNPQSAEFQEKIQTIFAQSITQILVNFLMIIFPSVVNFFKIQAFPRDGAEYFHKLTKSTKDYRIKNNVKRNDYFQLLLTLQQEEESGKSSLTHSEQYEEDRFIDQMDYIPKDMPIGTGSKFFTDGTLTAQAFVFLTAGTESVSSTLSFILYHVAKDKEIQQKMRDEILAKPGDWNYQTVKDWTYMDKVIQETQRMYPVVPMSLRGCTIPYRIPDSNYTIEKGTLVVIPVGGIQMDPKYYPNPEKFDPERFADNNHKPSPTFLPFGDGPRICIAMRFALMELKVCLGKTLGNFSVEVDNKTKEPFTFDRLSFFPRPQGGIWLKFKPLPAPAAH